MLAVPWSINESIVFVLLTTGLIVAIPSAFTHWLNGDAFMVLVAVPGT